MSVVAVSALAALGGVVAYCGLLFGGVYAACALSDRRRALQLARPGVAAHLRQPSAVSRVVRALRARLAARPVPHTREQDR